MMLFEMIYILSGIVYLSYSVFRRDAVTYFVNKYSKSSCLIVVKQAQFLNLQLKYSVLNSLYLMLFGVMLGAYSLNEVFFIAGALPFHLINLVMVMRSKTLGYADYKVGETYK